jgi:hypothetical protein
MSPVKPGDEAPVRSLALQPPMDVAFVTGLHRSGTTFMGNVLDAAEGTVMLSREPTNYRSGITGVPRWYPSLVEADLAGRTANAGVVDGLLRLTRGRPVRWRNPDARLRSLGSNVFHNTVAISARPRSRCLVVKDPFLSLAVPFVQRHLSRRTVLVAVRHPAAWALSLERVGWHPGVLVNQLLDREDLAAEVDQMQVPRRDWTAQPLYEASGWAWRILMGVAGERAGQTDTARYRVVPLESFKDDPLERALALIDDVGLRSSPRTVARLRTLTQGDVVAPTTTVQHVLKRDTSASVESWRSRMSPADQRVIWRICEPVAARYYRP